MKVKDDWCRAMMWPVALLVLILWLAGSSMDVEKYTKHFAIFILAGGVVTVFLILLGVRRAAKRELAFSGLVLGGLWLAVAALFAIIHPVSVRHTITQGNDSEDALYRGATNLIHLHYPYYSKTYLGNPITPMPGALILDLPFAVFNHAGMQNLVWLAAFFCFAAAFFKRSSTPVLFACLILANAHTFVNLMTGADYPVNCFYICVASYCFMKSSVRARGWQYWLSVVFLGVSLSSRLSYLLVVPIVLAGYCIAEEGYRRGLIRIAQPLVVTFLITAPFYLYDPAHFSPLHVANFLSAMTPAHQRLVFLILTGGAVCIASSSFFIKMKVDRFFLLAGLAVCMILLPPGVIVAFHQHFTFQGALVLGYTDTAYILLCLWLCSMLEGSLGIAGDSRDLTPVD